MISSAEYQSGPANTGKITTIGPYHLAFEQHLIDHGIFIQNDDTIPDNWDEIVEKTAQSRSKFEESCFSEDIFQRFKRSNNIVSTELTIMRTVLPIITGNAGVSTVNYLLCIQ